MRPLLLAALWIHLACCALLTGSFFMLLLAGPPRVPLARRWDGQVVRWSRVAILVAIGSGVAWLLIRTAVFENRPHAALEARAVWHAALDTWPGFVWLARHGVLVVLAAFLAMRADVAERWNWIGARGEALLLAALALVLLSASGHAAATSSGAAAAVAIDVVHLLATGLWVGALAPLALLLRAARRDDTAESRAYAVRAARRFSRAALLRDARPGRLGRAERDRPGGSTGALLGTTHGRLLLAKLAFLVPILALAAVNRARVLPALSDASGAAPRRRHAAARGIRLAGGRAGPRRAGAGRGHDAHDAGAPCRAGLAAAVPDSRSTSCSTRARGGAPYGEPARAARPRGADLGRSCCDGGAFRGSPRRSRWWPRRGARTPAVGGPRLSHHVPAPDRHVSRQVDRRRHGDLP